LGAAGAPGDAKARISFSASAAAAAFGSMVRNHSSAAVALFAFARQMDL
jgi:hypothetical protein